MSKCQLIQGDCLEEMDKLIKHFDTYFEQLLLIGACGNEDWQMLPFCLDAQSGIVSDCENAKEYRKLIGLQI